MGVIQIIADSTCDLNPSLIENMSLEILPLVLTLEEKSYLDGEEIRVTEVYDAMRRGVLPKTSQIPYERAYSVFKSIFEKGNDFIYIAFSGEMSGCFSLGSLIARELREEYPERKCAVIDSRGGSAATGLIVLQALRMARDGLPFDALESEIGFMVAHIEHIFSVGDLEWLARGGRIPKIVGYIGGKLGLRPILDVENGRIVFRRTLRGQNKAIRAVADEIILRAAGFPNQLIAISHADDRRSAEMLEALIAVGLPECQITLCHIGAVLGAHIGLKGIGAFCFNQRSAHYCFN